MSIRSSFDLLKFRSTRFNILRSRCGAAGRCAASAQLGFEPLESRRLLSLTPMLVADINTVPEDAAFPRDFVEVGGIGFFTAESAQHGWELWRTDGTTVGTRLVKDIRSGPESRYAPVQLTDVGGTLFFTADDGISGYELWKSDGTEAGTVQVRDIFPGPNGAVPLRLTDLEGTLYFFADDGVHGRELWKSDGTAAGTELVADLFPAGGVTSPSNLTSIDGTLYFGARYGLWKSDGTAAGTVLVKDGYVDGGVSSLTDVNGELFFEGRTARDGAELWKTNGTEIGTVLVRDLAPGRHSEYRCFVHGYYGCYYGRYVDVPNDSRPANLTSFKGQLYFAASDDSFQRMMYRSDGTEAGTERLAGVSDVSELTVLNEQQLLFVAADGASGAELWKTDGTVNGTTLVKDVIVGSGGSSPRYLANIGGSLFFRTANALWKSDGTEAGTARVADIQLLTRPVEMNGRAVFAARGADGEPEVWISDGTADGTRLVASIDRRNLGSSPAQFADVDGIVFFSADDGLRGTELWKSDGTAAGTAMLKDISPGGFNYGGHYYPYGTGLASLLSVGDTLFFAANAEFWKSDGTSAGTAPVMEFGPRNPSQFTNVNGTLYFTAGAQNGEIWKSDGTPEGTVLVKDAFSGDPNNSIRYLTDVDDTLFFIADGGSGYELWKSDGTESGTVQLRDIRPGPYGSLPQLLTNVAGTLYFSADDGGTWGRELWKSDGTANGTMVVKDIFRGADGAFPSELTGVNGSLFFNATSSSLGGPELWKSNGTAAGTVRVKRNGSAGNMTDVNGTLFFTDGTELWKSDGTDAGTVPVKVIDPDKSLFPLINANGRLFFVVSNGLHAAELWASDGTEVGTVPVAALGSAIPGPMGLTAIGDSLFFSADDVTHGRELWKVVVEPPQRPGDTDGDGDVDIDDLNNVRNAFGCTLPAHCTGDADGDGDTDIDDLNAVRNNFGVAAGPAIVSAPLLTPRHRFSDAVRKDAVFALPERHDPLVIGQQREATDSFLGVMRQVEGPLLVVGSDESGLPTRQKPPATGQRLQATDALFDTASDLESPFESLNTQWPLLMRCTN